MAIHPGAGAIHPNSVNTVGGALMKAKYRVQGPLITCYPDQLRPPPRPAGMSACSGRASPLGAGGGGGPPAESLEPRLPQQELGACRPLSSPALEACCQVPCPSPLATSALPQPPTLSSSLGKSPPSLRPSRLPMKSPQVMRFPMFYWRAQRPVNLVGGWGGAVLCLPGLEVSERGFPISLPPTPHSRGRGDPY